MQERIAAGLGLVPEDRQRDGLVQMMSVGENMSLASLLSTVKRFFIGRKTERENVDREIGDVRVKTAGPDALITSLSGGNQQKVVIGKMLLTNPKVLLLDEPTRGIDVGAKGEIFSLLFREAKKGLAVLYVTSEVGEALTASHRIIVMSKGRIVREFDPRTCTRDEIMAASGEHETVYDHEAAERSPPVSTTTATPAPPGHRQRRRAKARQPVQPQRAAGRGPRADRPGDHHRDLRRPQRQLPDRRQPDDDHQAGGVQRHRRARHAAGHPERRHRPLGRLDGRPDRGRRRQPVPRVHLPLTEAIMFPTVWVIVVLSVAVGCWWAGSTGC